MPEEQITLTPPKKKKNRIHTTLKQQEWVAKIAEGYTPSQATQIVYKTTDNQYKAVQTNRLVHNPKIQRMLEKAHLNEVKVVDTINGALDAETTWYKKNGEEVIKPNWLIRLKAAELALRLMGYLDRDKGGEVSKTPPEIKVQFIKIDEKAKVKALKSL